MASARPATPWETYQIHLRAEVGFPSTLAFVRRIDASPAAVTLADEVNIPVTKAEVTAIHQRDAVGDRIGWLDEREVRSATYAGAWLDQSAGGVLEIDGTQPPRAGQEASMARLFRRPDLLQRGTQLAPPPRRPHGGSHS